MKQRSQEQPTSKTQRQQNDGTKPFALGGFNGDGGAFLKLETTILFNLNVWNVTNVMPASQGIY